MTPHASSLLDELRPLVQRALSRRVHRHYNGFASNQLRFWRRSNREEAHLRASHDAYGDSSPRDGEVEADLSHLMVDYGMSDAAALIERKRTGERASLDPTLLEAWGPRIDALLSRQDTARATSPLPEAPPNNGEELRAWLLAVRRSQLR